MDKGDSAAPPGREASLSYVIKRRKDNRWWTGEPGGWCEDLDEAAHFPFYSSAVFATLTDADLEGESCEVAMGLSRPEVRGGESAPSGEWPAAGRGEPEL